MIYTNSNETLNDDTYDYESIGLPFLGDLDRKVYDYELKRERSVRPDFSRFNIKK